MFKVTAIAHSVADAYGVIQPTYYTATGEIFSSLSLYLLLANGLDSYTCTKAVVYIEGVLPKGLTCHA